MFNGCLMYGSYVLCGHDDRWSTTYSSQIFVVVVVCLVYSFLVLGSIREYVITSSKFKYLYFEVHVWEEVWLAFWWGS